MSRKDFKFENYLADLKKMSHEKLLAHAAVTGNALHIEQRKVEEARSDMETMLTELRALNECYLINRFKLENIEGEVAELKNDYDRAVKDAAHWKEIAEQNGHYARAYLTDLEVANRRADDFEANIATLENEIGRLRAELADARSLRDRLAEDLKTYDHSDEEATVALLAEWDKTKESEK